MHNSGRISVPTGTTWDVIEPSDGAALRVQKVEVSNTSGVNAEIGWGEQLPVKAGVLAVSGGAFIEKSFPFTADNPQAYAAATISLSGDVLLDSRQPGAFRDGETLTLEVEAAAANPTNTVLAVFSGTADAIVLTITPNNGTNNPANAAAAAVLNLTDDITLTSVAVGAARNTNTFTIQVLAATDNPTDTVLVAFTGTAAAITCTVTPNDGTNNGAVPVNLTTAELVQLINTGAVVGKNITLTDADSRRVLQTATGGGPDALADAGEGDGVAGTFTGGTTVAVAFTSYNLVELINTGAVIGKNVTLTDASGLRVLQTASGGATTPLADGGEGDGEVATFAGGFTEIVLCFARKADYLTVFPGIASTDPLGLEYWDGSSWTALTEEEAVDFESASTQILKFVPPSDWAKGGGYPGYYAIRIDTANKALRLDAVRAGRIIDFVSVVADGNHAFREYDNRPLDIVKGQGLFVYTDQVAQTDNIATIDYSEV